MFASDRAELLDIFTGYDQWKFVGDKTAQPELAAATLLHRAKKLLFGEAEKELGEIWRGQSRDRTHAQLSGRRRQRRTAGSALTRAETPSGCGPNLWP